VSLERVRTQQQQQQQQVKHPRRSAFVEDFRRFFLRGLAALLPTLITLWLLIKVWDFLWESLGRYIIWFISWLWYTLTQSGLLPEQQVASIKYYINPGNFLVKLMGVVLAVVLVYIVGLLVGNLIGRSLWKLGENAIFRIPLIRAIYPAVKQVTDFLLADKKSQFTASRVVAVEPHANGIWSIALVTGPGVRAVGQPEGKEMVTVFVPSSPTAFSGYVMIVPREQIVDLPLTVEQAMRLLISGGVIDPTSEGAAPTEVAGAIRAAREGEIPESRLPQQPGRPEAAAAAALSARGTSP
jgi:uncharacterized membrane protein